jgi:predicted amidophosphoribosyltransferase
VELLAQAVSAELGIPAIQTLEKFRDNRANSGLRDPAERRANVLGVYRPVQPGRFRGKRVLLLDDIVTTGATASECARVLLTAGAEEVIFGAVAAGGTTSSKKVQ